MKEIVRLENISKCYVKDKYVIRDCSLSVYEGEFLTILGPSGCGKTTVLRMISGLEMVSGGKVFLDGEDVTEIDAVKRPVNTIFQNFALFPHMTIEDNVGYGLKMKKVPKNEIKRRVKEMLDLVQLSGYEKRKPSQLSGGEQQRVAIARGLINKPKVLLLDEPLSSLDLKLKKQMQLELKRLQKKLGITFIYVTHAQDEALTMSDRIIIFKDGKIEQEGKPKEIYHHPNSLFVADFIGDSNILNGTVIKKTEVFTVIRLVNDDYVRIKSKEFELGDKVSIVVRPEDIHIKRKDASNWLEAKVKDVIYNGNFTRVIAIYQNQEIKINTEVDEEYHKGDIIYLDLDENWVTLIRGDNL
ncbi:MAG: ABC transporter ATP-binding protein [Bacilli bacterium]|nr:ABC transporter ATP-binding protein [Bacilli bacterium]